MPPASVIPSGYTFLTLDTFISVRGKELAEKLAKDAENRDPDAFDMYIYNDFYSYGVLDLVDRTLVKLHGKIVKKEWEDAYHILEGLIAFAEFEDVWTQCDDGERVDITNKAIGACAIAIFRGLDDNAQLDKTHFPSLENLLKNVAAFSEHIADIGCEAEYGFLCKAMARRLFKNKSKADFKFEFDCLNEWADGLEEEDKKEIKAEIKKMADEKAVAIASGKKVKPWYAKGKVCDEDDNDPDFKLSRVWKEYKKLAPTDPKRDRYDISKWSAEERSKYSFDSMDTEDY